MEAVDFDDVEEIIQLLNRRQGRNRHHLPAQAEWENAACAKRPARIRLATTQAALAATGGIETISGARRVRLVGSESIPGACMTMHVCLCMTMCGEVREWARDWMDDEEKYCSCSPCADSKRASCGAFRQVRGGSWRELADVCRSSLRRADAPKNLLNEVGFRPAFCREQRQGNRQSAWSDHVGSVVRRGPPDLIGGAGGLFRFFALGGEAAPRLGPFPAFCGDSAPSTEKRPVSAV
jgi:formylglycine-generating enzyme required for sulfatase activity